MWPAKPLLNCCWSGKDLLSMSLVDSPKVHGAAQRHFVRLPCLSGFKFVGVSYAQRTLMQRVVRNRVSWGAKAGSGGQVQGSVREADWAVAYLYRIVPMKFPPLFPHACVPTLPWALPFLTFDPALEHSTMSYVLPEAPLENLPPWLACKHLYSVFSLRHPIISLLFFMSLILDNPQ